MAWFEAPITTTHKLVRFNSDHVVKVTWDTGTWNNQRTVYATLWFVGGEKSVIRLGAYADDEGVREMLSRFAPDVTRLE